MAPDILPEGSYLASHYHDPCNGLTTRRVYYEDGRVTAFDGWQWWTVCHFSQDQIEQTQIACATSGLATAVDLYPDQKIYDAAYYTYAWSFQGSQGQVTNWAYPAIHHPTFVVLEQRLDQLEADAGG